MMEPLKKYCSAICCVDGVGTYIISPAQYASLMADQELLGKLISSCAKNSLKYFIQTAEKIDTLYLAFGHHKNRAGQSLEWEAALCYKRDDTFFHVRYRDSWMCRDCGYTLRAPIIMPLCEAEPDFYYETKNRFPAIPPFFQKRPCPNCGRQLQNHLIILP